MSEFQAKDIAIDNSQPRSTIRERPLQLNKESDISHLLGRLSEDVSIDTTELRVRRMMQELHLLVDTEIDRWTSDSLVIEEITVRAIKNRNFHIRLANSKRSERETVSSSVSLPTQSFTTQSFTATTLSADSNDLTVIARTSLSRPRTNFSRPIQARPSISVTGDVSNPANHAVRTHSTTNDSCDGIRSSHSAMLERSAWAVSASAPRGIAIRDFAYRRSASLPEVISLNQIQRTIPCGVPHAHVRKSSQPLPLHRYTNLMEENLFLSTTTPSSKVSHSATPLDYQSHAKSTRPFPEKETSSSKPQLHVNIRLGAPQARPSSIKRKALPRDSPLLIPLEQHPAFTRSAAKLSR